MRKVGKGAAVRQEERKRAKAGGEGRDSTPPRASEKRSAHAAQAEKVMTEAERSAAAAEKESQTASSAMGRKICGVVGSAVARRRRTA